MKTVASSSDILAIRLNKADKIRLESLARATGRSKPILAAEAVHQYLDLQEWQVRGIKAAIRQADAGDFADPQKVKAFFKRWMAIV